MIDNNKTIALNFLPIKNNNFDFEIYVNLSKSKTEEVETRQYKIPDKENNYINHWISFSPFEGAEKRVCNSNVNIHLTNWYLYTLLLKRAHEIGLQIVPLKNFYRNRIHLITEIYENKGKRTIWFEPYYLKIENKFGFLVDFKFIKDAGSPFNRETQRLSFSLDNNLRSNKNYSIDKFTYIDRFLKNDFKNLFLLSNEIEIIPDFLILQYDSLQIKQYLFNGNNSSNSQFRGLMEFGPYKSIKTNDLIYTYLFNADHKIYANDLIKALNGKSFPTFKGLEKFKLPNQERSNVLGIEIKNYSEFTKTLETELKKENKHILISVFPKNEEKFYYSLKGFCLENKIPLQSIHVETIVNKNQLKWSVSSLALQIFAKLGGIPWVVETKNNNCLIVGIGQALERNPDGKIDKFISYGILLDSSGEFIRISPLAVKKNKDEYLIEIANSIEKLLKENQSYERIVFHIPEKIKRNVTKKIEEKLKGFNGNTELYILRINDDSRFFGYDISHNSLIPYESSYIQLSNKEFLVWTEGLNYHNPTPRKRYSNPIYVEFFYSNTREIDNNLIKLLLQDILNLSGANFRGFNAKSLPVSIYYPKLISDFYKHFKKFNLNLSIIESNTPWFL